MDATAVIALFADLTQVELITWVERGWVLPDATGGSLEFHEIDVARVRLIHDLRRSMEVGGGLGASGVVATRPALRDALPAEGGPARGRGAAE